MTGLPRNVWIDIQIVLLSSHLKLTLYVRPCEISYAIIHFDMPNSYFCTKIVLYILKRMYRVSEKSVNTLWLEVSNWIKLTELWNLHQLTMKSRCFSTIQFNVTIYCIWFEITTVQIQLSFQHRSWVFKGSRIHLNLLFGVCVLGRLRIFKKYEGLWIISFWVLWK